VHCIELIHQKLYYNKVNENLRNAFFSFDSDVSIIAHWFYTPLVQHTRFALKIEKKKRIRCGLYEGKGYQSRIIDIDLIAFDEEIINLKKLQIYIH
jgi:hypothetical protein